MVPSIIDRINQIPGDTTVLDMSKSDLEAIKKNDFGPIFKKLPSHITLIKLRKCSYNIRQNELSLLLASLLNNIIHLDLSKTRLSQLDSAQITSIFSVTPIKLKTLDLSCNELVMLPDEDLVEALTILSNRSVYLELLNLSWNSLGSKTGEQLKCIFTALCPTLVSLNLGNNTLHLLTGKELALALGALPRNLTFLGLQANSLKTLAGEHLVEAFKELHPNINSVDLSANAFGFASAKKLLQTFNALPGTVISLNLSRNSLYNLTADDMILLKQSLPNIRTVYLSENEIKEMNVDQRAALRDIFPNVQNIILLDEEGNALGGLDSEVNHYFASKLGITNSPPSLKSIVAFFAKNEERFDKETEIPQELQEFISKF